MSRIEVAAPRRMPSVQAPGIILGIGLGGFFDGIFLHQVFQWHHMFSSVITADTVSGLRMNTLGDGIFHTVTWLSVLLGLWLLYSRITEARRAVWGSTVLWGWILSGWGWFNLVEGLLDHEILGLHHVRSGPHQVAWDMGFLAIGVIFILGGTTIARRATPIRDETAHLQAME
ncbi:DUF2243 domain-containing protein [Tanticharoenia sakaeratensis]|nr:DUF2243 domain-containing protein [Tanticharoenia sakaeratensis]